jgi:hypothetical protein
LTTTRRNRGFGVFVVIGALLEPSIAPPAGTPSPVAIKKRP